MRRLPFRIFAVIDNESAGDCREGWDTRDDDADSVDSDGWDMDCDCEEAIALSAFALTTLLPTPVREAVVDITGVDVLLFNLSMEARRDEGVMIPIASASRSSSSILRPKASDAAPI